LRQKLSGEKIRSVRIGATKTIGDYFLQEHIHKYLHNKENALTLIVDNTEHLLKMLEENVLDFAVIEGFFDKEQFDSVLLRREPFVGICRKDHPFAGREVTIEELLQQTIIHREAGSGTRAILEQELSGYNESLQRFNRHICISSFRLILDLVKQGFGISFVYNILADSDPDLAKFTIRGESVVREFNIVYLKYADMAEKIRWFFGEMD
jgi:DNA-binding transcriptional LysR family regulator